MTTLHRMDVHGGSGGTPTCSLESFPEYSVTAALDSPRSLLACASEGINPEDLIYKPLEDFNEKNLSPRLVQLRYDFHEAKRVDLLHCARARRQRMLSDESSAVASPSVEFSATRDHNRSRQSLSTARSGVSNVSAASTVFSSSAWRMERARLEKTKDLELKWLKHTLAGELRRVKIMEKGSTVMSEVAGYEERRTRENAERLKRLADKRREDLERREAEKKALQRIEAEKAMQSFIDEQQRLLDKAAEEAEDAKSRYLLHQQNEQKRMEFLKQQEEARKREYDELLKREREVAAREAERQMLLEKRRQEMQENMRRKKEERERQTQEALKQDELLRQQKLMAYEEKQKQEQLRDEYLSECRALKNEENAKKSFQLQLQRSIAAEEASRKLEETRANLVQHREETEFRLHQHQEKKKKYHAFKKELDTLKERNKELNVERQRRREEFKREQLGQALNSKLERAKALDLEKQQMWQERKKLTQEAGEKRKQVKEMVAKMQVTSNFSTAELEKMISSLEFADSPFDVDLPTLPSLSKSASSPMLTSKRVARASAAAATTTSARPRGDVSLLPLSMVGDDDSSPLRGRT